MQHPLALTPAETAALLQVSVKRVRLLVALGKLDRIPDYRPIRVPFVSIERYLATRAVPAAGRSDELAARRAAFEARYGGKATGGAGHANGTTKKRRAASALN
jgi:hypothetical protein